MYRKQKKIPTILALFILFAGIGGVIFFNQNNHQLGSKAQTISSLEDIHFTNISDNSFTISWFTATNIIETVVVNDNGRYMSYFEDADNDNIARPRMAHFVTAKNLKENTSYEIKIINGEENCKISRDCPTFTQKTANHLANPISLPAARGTLITDDNKPADNAIVYLTIGKSPPLSGKTDSLGLWVIPFNNLRTDDLLSKPSLSDNDIVQITAKTSPDKKAEAVIDIKSIRQNLSIPPLQIGKSYNLIDLISKKDLLASLNKSTNTLGIQSQIGGANKSIDILFPSSDGDTTIDNQPRFRGIGLAGKQLIITVNSAPQTSRIIVAADGTWVWRPTIALEPGTHHLGISGYDEKGNYITLTRTFIVLKSGEQVLGEATASATLTPTINPTATPTLILLPSPTITLVPIPSPTINLTPSIPVGTVSTTPMVPPKTGNINSTLILLGGGASLFLIGLSYFFFHNL